MARTRKKSDKTLSYSIKPHPKGLGFIVIEHIGEFQEGETGWRRYFSSQCLCKSAIKKRKEDRDKMLNTVCKPCRFHVSNAPLYDQYLKKLGLVDFSK